MGKRKLLSVLMVLIGIVILGGIIYFADPVLIFNTILRSNPWFILGAFVLANLNIVLRTGKWRVLLKNVSVAELLPVQILGMSLSNFTPGKMGDPIKAVLLKIKKNIPVHKGLSTVIWERILDLIVLVIFSTFVMFFVAVATDFFYIGVTAVLIFIFGISLLLAILSSQRIGRKIFQLLRKLPLLNKIKKKFIDQFYKSSKLSKKRLLASFLITIVCWVLDGVILYMVFLSLGLSINPFIIAGFIAFSTLVGVASSLPGGLGSMEAVFVLLLATLGVATAEATTGVLIGRFLTFWYGAFIGGLSFIHISRKVNLSELI